MTTSKYTGLWHLEIPGNYSVCSEGLGKWKLQYGFLPPGNYQDCWYYRMTISYTQKEFRGDTHWACLAKALHARFIKWADSSLPLHELLGSMPCTAYISSFSTKLCALSKRESRKVAKKVLYKRLTGRWNREKHYWEAAGKCRLCFERQRTIGDAEWFCFPFEGFHHGINLICNNSHSFTLDTGRLE